LSDAEFWDSTPAEFSLLMKRTVKREEAYLGVGGAKKKAEPVSRAAFWKNYAGMK
jgi:hypothetical protein